MFASYVGDNKIFTEQFLSGELEVEFNPQGTLAERIRAAGAAFRHSSRAPGVGTVVRRGQAGPRISMARTMSWRRPLKADLALVHAHKGDTEGNLVYRMTAQNFNR